MRTGKDIRIIYKVCFDHPTSREERILSKSSRSSWSSLMNKVFSNKYTDLVSRMNELKYCINDPSQRITVENLTPILKDNNIIGIVDLISSSFLFNRSPLDLQLFILAGLGMRADMLMKMKK